MPSQKLIPLAKGEQEFDTTYSDCVQYGRIQFWDARYAEESECFEWYYGFDYFRSTINENVPKDWSVLYAGCGSSNLGADLVADGYTDVTIGDISRVALHQQKIRHKGTALKYFQGTMLDTNLPAHSVSCIIDKALFDSLMCSTTGDISIRQYMFEIERLLKDDGVFILISSANPEARLGYLEQYDIDEPGFTPWFIEVQAVMKPIEFANEELDIDDPESMYFVYICTKDEELLEKKGAKDGKREKRVKKKKTKKAPLL